MILLDGAMDKQWIDQGLIKVGAVGILGTVRVSDFQDVIQVEWNGFI